MQKTDHQLPSFSGYINKVFHFRKALSTLRDRRQNPDISPKTIFLSLFYAFVFRFTSFRQLEADLAQPHLQRWAETPRAFGDDVLRYSLASFELAPLEQMVVEIFGWDLVITLKQENRTLYEDAHGLFRNRAPDDQLTETQANNVVEAQLWQAEDLPFTEEHTQPMRVVRSEERKTECQYRRGKPVSETKYEQWVWITTQEAKTFSSRTVRQLGHDRWKLENNGWCDLTKHWAFKHGFLHACKHRPQRRDPQGKLQPLPNCGLMAVTWILCIAFLLCSAFARLHSKLFRRNRLSVLEISRQLYRSLWSLQPPIRAPD